MTALGRGDRAGVVFDRRLELLEATAQVFDFQALEGAQQDAESNVIGVKASGLNNQGIGNTTSAPLYPEVLAKICQRWSEPFPKRAAPDTSSAGK